METVGGLLMNAVGAYAVGRIRPPLLLLPGTAVAKTRGRAVGPEKIGVIDVAENKFPSAPLFARIMSSRTKNKNRMSDARLRIIGILLIALR
jgi:hypothetical protein